MFYILLFICVFMVVQAVRQIWIQQAHLTEEEIQTFVDLKMDSTSEEYTRFIGHLAGCEACQERLDAAQSNDKNIEQHLV